MEITANRAAKLVAILLLATVATQVTYVVMSENGMDVPRMLIWTVEAVVFLGISVFALTALARGSSHAVACAAIAVGGILNVIQVGMGLAMFGPVKAAGEAMEPAYQAILAGAFFLYFAGKFLFGFAAIIFANSLRKNGTGVARMIAGIVALASGVAIAANLHAMAVGMEVVFRAGAAGTVATFFLAVVILMNAPKDEATA